MTYNPDLETQLRLFVDGNEIPFPEKSSLFVSCSIAFIDQASRLRRTVNGTLVSTARPQFRKRRVTLSASDRILPATYGIAPDALCVVHCPIVVRERGNTPTSAAVPGSVLVGPEGEWVEYRPLITGRVLPGEMNETEWQSSAGWSLTVEEV